MVADSRQRAADDERQKNQASQPQTESASNNVKAKVGGGSTLERQGDGLAPRAPEMPTTSTVTSPQVARETVAPPSEQKKEKLSPRAPETPLSSTNAHGQAVLRPISGRQKQTTAQDLRFVNEVRKMWKEAVLKTVGLDSDAEFLRKLGVVETPRAQQRRTQPRSRAVRTR